MKETPSASAPGRGLPAGGAPADELRELLSLDAREVAPLLLGAVLTHEGRDGAVSVRITEVEAYLGPHDSLHPDPGSHTFRGATARNAVMFGPAGHLYVYFTYGMHHCANVVCGPEGVASAVLLRAGEIVAGEGLALARRTTSKSPKDLASGPARLATALGHHDGGQRPRRTPGTVQAGTSASTGCGRQLGAARRRLGRRGHPRLSLAFLAERRPDRLPVQGGESSPA